MNIGVCVCGPIRGGKYRLHGLGEMGRAYSHKSTFLGARRIIYNEPMVDSQGELTVATSGVTPGHEASDAIRTGGYSHEVRKVAVKKSVL